VNIITQSVSLNQGTGVYPFSHKYDFLKNIDQIQILTWGVKWNLPVLFPRGKKKKIGRKTESEGISIYARKRLIKMTSAMEQLGAKVSHMATFTLPPARWEAIPNDQKSAVWRTAKRKLLRALEKLLSRQGKETSYFWFQEFQERNNRGAPHLHVLIDIGQLTDNEWHKMLKGLIHIWKNSLNWNDKDGEFPNQSVDFGRMKKSDFRYARKYASKAEQKNAPFIANWGRWWGRGGIWKTIKPHDYAVNLNLLSKDDQKAMMLVFKNNKWLTWGLLKSRNKDLHDKLQKILLLPFDYSRDKHTAVEKMVFERVIKVLDEAEDKHTTVKKMYFEQEITENNKKDDMLFSKHIVSFSFPDNQIIHQPPTLCQEATNPCQGGIKRSEEKAIQTNKQLTLDITLFEGV